MNEKNFVSFSYFFLVSIIKKKESERKKGKHE
jgi:hypothetical protein